MLKTKVRLLLDAKLAAHSPVFNRSSGTVWYGNADGFLVKSFSLGLDERNRPVCLRLSLHVLPKPARRYW